MKIIYDSEGIFQSGDEITITANTILEEYSPKLKKGMRMVVTVPQSFKNETGRNNYAIEGMYYVTEDDYVVSVFQEDVKTAKNGMKVDDLLHELKK